MATARSTYQNQEKQLFASPEATYEYQHPGYTTAEQEAINSATDQAIAGENAKAQALARSHAALTGNGAGLTTALQRMQDTAGMQSAQAAANNAAEIAKARQMGMENAIGQIGENQRAAVDDQQRQANTGFWSNFTNALGKGLGAAPGQLLTAWANKKMGNNNSGGGGYGGDDDYNG